MVALSPILVALSVAAAPVQSTFAGGARDELPFDTLVESAQLLAVSPLTGDVYLVAATTSDDFPAAQDGAQPARAGDADVVVVRLNAALTTFLGATYLGGTGTDRAGCLGVNPVTGDVYVCGSTTSADFPITDATTYVGPDNADGFVAVLTASLDTLVAATYLASTAGGDAVDEARALAFDVNRDQILVALSTTGTAFAGTTAAAQPVSGGATDVVVMRLTNDLVAGVATFLGGVGDDYPASIISFGGSVVVGGRSSGPASFPGVSGGAMSVPPTSGGAGFVALLAQNLNSVDAATLVTGSEFGAPVLAVAASGVNVVATAVANGALADVAGDFPGPASGAVLMFNGALSSVTAGVYLAADTFASGIVVATNGILVGGTTRATALPSQVGPGTSGNDFFVSALSNDLVVTRSTFGGQGAAFSHAALGARADGGLVLAGFAGAGTPAAIAGAAQQQAAGGVDLFAMRFDASLSIENTCGDTVIDGTETCDDANVVAADGCSANCRVESGFVCDGAPSLCGPDVGDDDNDGLTNAAEIAAGTDPQDSDSDDDTVLDGEDGTDDTDGDTFIDALDSDDDDDGIDTSVEKADAGTASDFDADGLSNWDDVDSDDDGRLDATEGRKDRDGDNKLDYLDAAFDPGGVLDENDDGYSDALHGAGGGFINCQQTGGGPLALLLLGALWPLLRLLRRRHVAVLATLSVLALPAAAHDDGSTFAAQRLRPSVDREGLLEVEGARVEGELNVDAALWGDYQLNPVTVFSRDSGSAVRKAALVQHRIDANAVAAVTLLDRLQLAVDIPVVVFQARDDAGLKGLVRTVEPLQAFGVGDPRAMVKLRLMRQGEDSASDVALMVSGTAPVTNQLLQVKDPSFIGEKGFTVAPALAFGRKEGWFRFLGNFGVRLRQQETQFVDIKVGNEVFYAAGAGFTFREWLDLPLELDAAVGGQLGMASEIGLSTAPVEATLGASYELFDTVQLFGGVGAGITAGYQTPDLRALFGVRFSPRVRDRDEDGLQDGVDQCPNAAEDADGFQDDDGCPDNDNDKDGVADALDQCPAEAEDVDNFDDDDGCADADDDKDGVMDVDDKCPQVAGLRDRAGCPAPDADKDGVPDDGADLCLGVMGTSQNGGCPDGDNDGVIDNADRCPDKAGKKSLAGCPDTDKDGFSDADDKCPDQAEVINGVDDTDGCPDEGKSLVKVTATNIEILDKVFFDTSKATIKTNSFPLLDQVAAVLRSSPQLKKVRIEGHCDDVGDDAKNLKLSQDRATSVRDYLVNKGIDVARLQAQGFGETKPIGDNKTPAGRDQNRRVEFAIVEQSQE